MRFCGEHDSADILSCRDSWRHSGWDFQFTVEEAAGHHMAAVRLLMLFKLLEL